MLYSWEFYKIIFIFTSIPLKWFAVPVSPYFAKIGGTDDKLRKYVFQTLRVPVTSYVQKLFKNRKRIKNIRRPGLKRFLAYKIKVPYQSLPFLSNRD